MAPLISLFATILAISSCKSQSIPITNPVSDLYGNVTEYSWTNKMVNWSCVLSVSDYNKDFESTQSAVLKACPSGGVVYFPAGTYEFTDNLNIKGGIVIRGEATTSPAKNGRNPGSLSPKTIFKCPNMKHMGIFNALQQGSASTFGQYSNYVVANRREIRMNSVQVRFQLILSSHTCTSLINFKFLHYPQKLPFYPYLLTPALQE